MALFQDVVAPFVRVYVLVLRFDVVWPLERFLAGTRSSGETDSICTDYGGESKRCFAELSYSCIIKRTLVTPGTPRLNGCLERSLALM